MQPQQITDQLAGIIREAERARDDERRDRGLILDQVLGRLGALRTQITGGAAVRGGTGQMPADAPAQAYPPGGSAATRPQPHPADRRHRGDDRSTRPTRW